MTEQDIKKIQEKAIAVMSNSEALVQHTAALSYCKDPDEIEFHCYWINRYLQRLKSSVISLNNKEV